MSYRSRTAAICLAALSLVAAGCGSDSQSTNDYVTAINKVQTNFAKDVKTVGTEQSGGDPAAAAKKTFADLMAAIDRVVADLKAVKPPDKVKDLHNQLVSEMSQFDSQVKAAGESLSSKDPKAIETAQTQFASSASTLGTQISQTIGAINKKLRS
jgi:hypothetical protein